MLAAIWPILRQPPHTATTHTQSAQRHTTTPQRETTGRPRLTARSSSRSLSRLAVPRLPHLLAAAGLSLLQLSGHHSSNEEE